MDAGPLSRIQLFPSCCTQPIPKGAMLLCSKLTPKPSLKGCQIRNRMLEHLIMGSHYRRKSCSRIESSVASMLTQMSSVLEATCLVWPEREREEGRQYDSHLLHTALLWCFYISALPHRLNRFPPFAFARSDINADHAS